MLRVSVLEAMDAHALPLSQGAISGAVTVQQVKVLPLYHPSLDDSLPQSSTGSRLSLLHRNCRWWKWERMFPCIRWMKSYNLKEDLKADIIAGTTVGTMLIPQAMSYAKLAGLHPIFGLYSGLVPVFTYAVFGSSRQLAIGPVALVSLLIYNCLYKITKPDENKKRAELAILLALMVGLLECFMGLLRLGWVIRFVSHSVISGFTTASAIIIGLSQAKYFLGYEVARSNNIIPLLASIIEGYEQFKWHPFLMGSVVLMILLVMKHLGKSKKKLMVLRAAGPLTAVVFSTIFIKLFQPSGISLVGPIPQGLPRFSAEFKFDYLEELFSTALVITGVAILESVGIAIALAAKNGYEIDPNQELFGLGVANVFGSLFHAYPVTGSFSRSAVSHESGAKTGLAGIQSGLIICSALLFLTPAFENTPQCALAAIVISAVIGLIDYDEAVFLWRVNKKDFFLWLAATLNTLYFGIEIGVLIAVVLSLIFVIHESANPHIAVLGRLPGTTVYRNVKQYPDAYTYPGIVIVRVDAPIYFANISFIKDKLRKYEFDSAANVRGEDTRKIQFIIVDMSPVTYIDSTAIHALKELYQEYKVRLIQMAISNPNEQVMRTLGKAGIPDLIGREWYFVRVHDAVRVCRLHMQKQIMVKTEVNNLEVSAIDFDRVTTQGDTIDSSSHVNLVAIGMKSTKSEKLPLLVNE